MYVTSTNDTFAYGTIYGLFLASLIWFVSLKLIGWIDSWSIPSLNIIETSNKKVTITSDVKLDQKITESIGCDRKLESNQKTENSSSNIIMLEDQKINTIESNFKVELDRTIDESLNIISKNS